MSINYEWFVAITALVAAVILIPFPIFLIKQNIGRYICIVAGVVLLILVICVAHLPTEQVETLEGEGGITTVYNIAEYSVSGNAFCVIQNKDTFEFIGVGKGWNAEKFSIPVDGTKITFLSANYSRPQYIVRSYEAKLARIWGPFNFISTGTVEERTISVEKEKITQSYELDQ